MLKKFSDWMNFNPPEALDWDGWDDFRDEFRKEAPIRYFITRVLDRKIRRLSQRIKDAIWWVRHRTTNRYHVVRTGLKPGWSDVSETILHTNFTMLVDFVEIEKAWMSIVFDEKKRKEYLGLRRFLPRILRQRCFGIRDRELGLAHLDWEITLGDESPVQSASAQVIKDLYIWWKDIRPLREEVRYPDEVEAGSILSSRWCEENPEKATLIRDWADNSHKQEEQWNQEDTDKLVELAKVRLSLWT